MISSENLEVSLYAYYTSNSMKTIIFIIVFYFPKQSVNISKLLYLLSIFLAWVHTAYKCYTVVLSQIIGRRIQACIKIHGGESITNHFDKIMS